MNAMVPAVQQPDAPQQSSGAALYRVSTDAAAICREIVLATAKNIGGRNYVAVEGWQAIALAHGCVASSGDVKRHEDGSFSAIGRIMRADTGMIISSAEGYVGADEPVWYGGEGKDKYGKVKVYPRRPDYAIRAMAQTRAISRAARSAFAHVVIMMQAGLMTTPAEEVPSEGFEDHRQEARRRQEEEELPPTRAAAPPPPPAEPRRPTQSEWLDVLQTRLDAAPDEPSVLEIITSEDVKKATGMFKNGSLTRLNRMINAALQRVGDFPFDGDGPRQPPPG
jgi:hypothetical protein